MDGARNEGDLMQQHRQQPPENHDRHRQQRPPPPSCPRCDSSNTKFCYYNNYSLSQPRYFCKACRRYWTQGGSLRTVPIGGGCRKPKRQKTPASASALASASPSPASGLNPRTQGLSAAAAAAWSQNLFPSQPPPLPAAPPVVPPLGGSFFAGGGSSLSALAAMQSFPVGRINHGAAAMPGGGGRFGSNMALLQGMTFPSLKSPAPPPTRFFPPQQSYVPPLRFSSWPHSVINTGGSSSSTGGTSGLRSSGGGDQAGPSFTPNQWSSSNLGINPSE